jgi:hypothetical protein
VDKNLHGGALGRVSHGFGDTRRKETGEKRELTGDLHRGGMGRTLELSLRDGGKNGAEWGHLALIEQGPGKGSRRGGGHPYRAWL